MAEDLQIKSQGGNSKIFLRSSYGCTRNTNWRGSFSTIDLLIKVNYLRKVNTVCIDTTTILIKTNLTTLLITLINETIYFAQCSYILHAILLCVLGAKEWSSEVFKMPEQHCINCHYAQSRYTAWHFAVSFGRHRMIVKSILNANPEGSDQRGATPETKGTQQPR